MIDSFTTDHVYVELDEKPVPDDKLHAWLKESLEERKREIESDHKNFKKPAIL